MRRFSGRRGTRERTEWVGVIGTVPIVVAVNALSKFYLMTQANMEEFPGGRVDRIIGNGFVSPATSPAGASGYSVFYGVTKTNPTEIFDPELAPEHRWMHWGAVAPQIGGSGAANDNSSRWIGYMPLSFDYRPRTRMQEDEDLVLIFKNSSNSAASIQYFLQLRMLIALGAK